MCFHSKIFLFLKLLFLSLNMLAQFCSPFFFSLSLCQGSVLEYTKHAVALLLPEHNVVKLDDFVKKYDANKT